MPAAEKSVADRRKRPPRASETSLLAWAWKMLHHKPRLGLRTDSRILFFVLLGGIAGTLLDALHVWNLTARYDNVWRIPYLNVAWYVPFEFTAAGVIVGMLRPELDEEMSRKRSDLSRGRVLFGVGCFFVAWAGSGLLTRAGVPDGYITLGLGTTAVGVWALSDRTWQGVAAAVLTAFLGVTVEAMLVWQGTYYYTNPSLFGVPMWLPLLYLTACVAIGNLGRFLKYSWDPNLRAGRAEPERRAA